MRNDIFVFIERVMVCVVVDDMDDGQHLYIFPGVYLTQKPLGVSIDKELK